MNTLVPVFINYNYRWDTPAINTHKKDQLMKLPHTNVYKYIDFVCFFASSSIFNLIKVKVAK